MDRESSDDVDAGQQEPSGLKTSDDIAGGATEFVDKMNARYEPGSRESVTVPGTGGTVAGTAFADHVTEMSDEKVEDLDEQFSNFREAVEERQRDEG